MSTRFLPRVRVRVSRIASYQGFLYEAMSRNLSSLASQTILASARETKTSGGYLVMLPPRGWRGWKILALICGCKFGIRWVWLASFPG